MILLAMLIALPFGIVFGFPIMFPALIIDSQCFRNKFRRAGCLCKSSMVVLLFLIGCVLNVIVVPLELIAIVPGLIMLLVYYIAERIKLYRRYAEAIERRKVVEDMGLP